MLISPLWEFQGVREVSLGEEALHAIEHTPVYSMLPNASAIVQTLREIPELVVETKLREVSQLSSKSEPQLA